ILKEHARTLVHASPALRPELLEETEHELRFRGNRALLAIPCNARSVRGYAASFIAFDEQAHFRGRVARRPSRRSASVGFAHARHRAVRRAREGSRDLDAGL